MRGRQRCVGCNRLSPETETNYTLISAQYGWRLTRKRAPDGMVMTVEWRCPGCWRSHRAAGHDDAAPPSEGSLETGEPGRQPERRGLADRVRALLPSMKRRSVPPRGNR